MHRDLTICILATLVFSLTNVYADRYYVNLNANGANDGSSWENAFTSLGSALNIARSDSEDEIWVASGNYPNSLYYLKPNCSLYGGFSGNETSIDQRDLETNKTSFTPSNDRPLYFLKLGVNSRLDGFHFEGLEAEEYSYTHIDYDGNGEDMSAGLISADMPIYGKPPIIKNTKFINCSRVGDFTKMTAHPFTGDWIQYYSNYDEVVFVNCLFENISNQAVAGNVNFYNCLFINSGFARSGFHVNFYAFNCIFYAQHSHYLYGIFYNGNAESFVNCTIFGGNFGLANHDSFMNTINLKTTPGGMFNDSIKRNIADSNTGNIGLVNFYNIKGSDNKLYTDDDGYLIQEDFIGIDLGSNAHIPVDIYDIDSDGDFEEFIDIDFLGNPRVQGTSIDIGAVEFSQVNLLLDSDGDGILNFIEEILGRDPNVSDLNLLHQDLNGINLVNALQTAEAERDARPTQVAYDAVVAERDAKLTLNEVKDLRPGSTMIEVSGNQATVQLQMEESSDLETWTETGDTASMTIPVPADTDTKFFRFKMAD